MKNNLRNFKLTIKKTIYDTDKIYNIIIEMSEVKSRIPLEGNYRKGWHQTQAEQVS